MRLGECSRYTMISRRLRGVLAYEVIAHNPVATPTPRQAAEKLPTGTESPAHAYDSTPVNPRMNPMAV